MSLLEFRRICRMCGMYLSEQQLARLGKYVELLLDWNAKINLISRRDQENVWFAHLLHSVSPWFFVEIGSGLRVLDLGTGGGLPGIPLAILRPDLRLTLLDSIRKKTEAVDQMVHALGLVNVEVVVGRAEEKGRNAAHAHSYDVVIARAVARLADLVKWSRLFLKVGSNTPPEPVSRNGTSRGSAVEADHQTLRGGPGEDSGGRIRLDGPCLLTLKGGDLEGEIREAVVRGATVRALPLAFPGSEQIGLEEKRLLVVHIR